MLKKFGQKVVVKNLTSLLYKIGKKVAVKYLTSLLHSDNSNSPVLFFLNILTHFPSKLQLFDAFPDKIQHGSAFGPTQFKKLTKLCFW